jgi:hypothetical protein
LTIEGLERPAHVHRRDIMTRFARLLSAALAAASVAALSASPANATVVPRPTINIPTVRPALPATHVPTRTSAQQWSPSKPPAPSHKITFTPVKYPEITDAYGRPMGYVNAQGQAVYFSNGRMPAGFSVGPNHTILTYIKS